ncbi:MAG: hypothetical protein OCD76_13230 [Reichenbachiella sp.]
MIVSQHKTGQFILRSLLLLAGVAIGLVANLILIQWLEEFNHEIIIVFFFMLSASIPCVIYGISVFSKVKIDPHNKTLSVTYFGRFTKSISLEKSWYAKRHANSNNNLIEHLVVQSEDGAQLNFGSQVFKNYNEMSEAVVKLSRYRNEMNVKYLKPFSKFAAYYFGIMLGITMLYFLMRI